MSDQIFFDVVLGVLSILNGVANLRIAHRGTLRPQEFITFGKNPIQSEQMTPGMRGFTWYLGVTSLALGALFIAGVIYHSVRG